MGDGLRAGEGVCVVASPGSWPVPREGAALTVAIARTRNAQPGRRHPRPRAERRPPAAAQRRDRARDLILRALFSAARSGRMWSPCSPL